MPLKHRLLAASYPVLRFCHSFSRYTRTRGHGRLRVLVYHDIAPFEVDSFAAQLRWLSKYWRFVDAQTFAAMVSGDEPVHGDNLLLTFDDGFASNRIVAEKVLHQMGIRAVFFVVSGFVELSSTDDCHAFIAKGIRSDIDPASMPNHWKNMNWVDLAYLLDAGHTIGAHTATHARLSQLAASDTLEAEIISSADLLEDRLGVKVEHFAFTFGDIASLSCMALNIAKRRFKYIYTSLRGDNAHDISPLMLYRDTIAPHDPHYLTGAFLEGGADLAYRRARIALKRCV